MPEAAFVHESLTGCQPFPEWDVLFGEHTN